MTFSTCMQYVLSLSSIHIVMHGTYNAENQVQHMTRAVKFKGGGAFVIF